jgi:hypothetical protein
MIVDANVGIERERYPIERALEVLGAANIRKAVVFAEAHAENLTEQNAYVLESAREYEL